MLTTSELENRVKAVVEKYHPPGTILEVHCIRDLDHVQEPVVWVRFVVRDGAMPFDPKRQLQFGLELRLAFDDWGETAYPVPSFYPETEYRQVFPAAA